MHFSIISQIYIVSSFVGMGFMVVSTLLGKVPRHGGHGGAGHGHAGHSGGTHSGAGQGAGAHAGHGHAGHAGHGGPIQSAGANHGGTRVSIGHNSGTGNGGQLRGGSHNAGTGHGASGQAHNAAHVASTSHAANTAHAPNSAPGANSTHAGTGAPAPNPLTSTGPIVSEPSGIIARALGKVHGLHVELKEENLLETILGIFNPLTMATFMTFFGLAGAGVSIGLHWPLIFSLPVAIVAGYVAVQVVVHSIAWLFENLGSSTEARVADFVGRMAEVSIPIDIGKTGEVIYVIGAKRYASAAKSMDPTLAISKRSKVMISEVRDHLVFVEPWTDTFIDPDFDSPRLHSGQP